MLFLQRVFLLLAGLIALLIGAVILLAPVALHATTGSDLTGQISLLSEIRAPGGLLLVCGALILAGAFVSRLTFAATLVATLAYLSYGLSRFLSLTLDGVPAPALVLAMIAELVLGAIGLVFLVRQAQRRPSGASPALGRV
jgi:hypothetical protein